MAEEEYAQQLSKIVKWFDMNLRTLPVKTRRDVVLNLVKNVSLDVVEETHRPNTPGHFEAYERECDDFAEQVMYLPEQYRALRQSTTAGCGNCPRCLAKKASREAQQQAKN